MELLQPRSPRDLAAVRNWDASDPLRTFRDRFDLPPNVVYLDGNSLGALPRATRQRMAQVVADEWGVGLIRSWNDCDWIRAPRRVGDKIARLIGAEPGEVIVADSTSANLFKLINVALAARPGRREVLSEPGNFPSDLYVIDGALRGMPERRVRLEPADRLMDAISADTALVLLTQVHYKTAAMHDMRAITARAHEKGALVLWDLSHSVGALQVDLNGCDADFAVGCGYKYLNGGPGAPAFLFVARRHLAGSVSPLSGWMGHDKPFDFVDGYAPAAGIERFLCGTPPILGLLSLECGVDLLLEAGMAALQAKSQRLCQLFISLVQDMCGDQLQLLSPTDPRQRGSHLAYAHPNGYAVMRALIDRGVIGDFRAPDTLRFGVTPLYTRYEDVWHAVVTLRDVLQTQCWSEPRYAVRAAVT
ncbi:MAG TPA: kynureninase [Steroidobacteraceae bacterium]|nr:kynureninase [Steroidobacteraceae bacterium]